MMSLSIPVIAVLGHKNSGKTTVVENVISEMLGKRFHVASGKHIGDAGFSVDVDRSDSWHHSKTGANPVLIVSDTETTIMIKNGMKEASVENLAAIVQRNGADGLVLEGFSQLVSGDRRIGKIICLRNLDEQEEFQEMVKGEIVAFCSLKTLGEGILEIGRDIGILREQAAGFIEKRRQIVKILSQLAGLDCRKCGRSTCEELAEDIFAGKTSLQECVTMKLKPLLKTKIIVGDDEVVVQPFVSEIIRKTVIGMVSSLKGVEVEGGEDIVIEIRKKQN